MIVVAVYMCMQTRCSIRSGDDTEQALVWLGTIPLYETVYIVTFKTHINPPKS